LDPTIGIHKHNLDFKGLTSQNDHFGGLDKTSVLYSGGSVFNC